LSRGGRSNYSDGLGSIDYFYESNRYFLPVTLDPITNSNSNSNKQISIAPYASYRGAVSFIAIWAERLQVQVFSDMNPCVVRTQSDADCCMSLCIHRV